MKKLQTLALFSMLISTVLAQDTQFEIISNDTSNLAPMVVIRNQSPSGFSNIEFYDSEGINSMQVGYSNSQTNFSSSTGFIHVERPATPLIFWMQGQEKMGLQPNGNFGIGTTQPALKLDLLNIDSSNTESMIKVKNNAPRGFAGMEFFDYQGTNTLQFGYANINTNFNAGNSFIHVERPNTAFNVLMQGIERLRLQPNGNFGIATDDPMRTLDINGRLRIQDVPNSGSGDLLVIDGNGDVYKLGGIALQSSIAKSIKKDLEINSDRINQLVQENETLRTRLDQMEKLIEEITSNQKKSSVSTQKTKLLNHESKQ